MPLRNELGNGLAPSATKSLRGIRTTREVDIPQDVDYGVSLGHDCLEGSVEALWQ